MSEHTATIPPLGDVLLHTQLHTFAETEGSRILGQHHLKVARGQIRARISGIRMRGVEIYHLSYGAPLTVVGPPLNSHLDVLMPARGSLRIRGTTDAEAHAMRSAAVLAPDAPIHLEWTAGVVLNVLRLDLHELREFARTLTGTDQDLRSFPTVISDPVQFNALQGVLSAMTLSARTFGRHATWPAALGARIREQALTNLLMTLPGITTDAHRHLRGDALDGDEITRVAIQLIESQPLSYLSTGMLADDTGVSLRTLQNAFRTHRSTTPHNYITKVRLQRAREDLLSASPDNGLLVTEIARRWGFLNAGRMAALYRAEFGEMPSETKRH